MTNEQTFNRQEQHREAGMGEMFGSMMNLASACTRFTFHQMSNMMNMFTSPRKVMNDVKCSIDNLSDAMNPPSAHAPSTDDAADPSMHRSHAATHPREAEDALSGRKI